MRRLTACSLIVLAAACAPRTQTVEVRQAEAEASTGDWEAALEKYRVALRENPNDSALKKKIAEAEKKCADIWTKRAQQSNAEGRITEAAELWRRALLVTPAEERPASPAARDVTENQSAIEYAAESASAEGRHSEALWAFTALELVQPDRPGLRERVVDAKKKYAVQLVVESDGHWKREMAGASLAANLRALQYDPLQEKAFENANDLRRVLKKRSRFTLDGVTVADTGHKQLGTALTQKLTPRLDDYPPYGPWPAKDTGGRAQFSATIEIFEKSEVVQEGVDEMPNTLAPKLDPVPNPAVELQKAKVDRLEKKLAELQAKMKAALADKKKKGNEKPGPVNEDPGLVLARDIDKTRIDIASAKARLEQLPPTIIPPPPDPTWKLPWTRTIRTVDARVRFEFRDPDFADAIIVSGEHKLEKSDRQHAGNAAQGVEPDKLVPPDWDAMIGELADTLANQAVAAIENARKRRVDGLLGEGRHQQRSNNPAEATNAYIQLLFLVGPEGLPNDAAAFLATVLENDRLKEIPGPQPNN